MLKRLYSSCMAYIRHLLEVIRSEFHNSVIVLKIMELLDGERISIIIRPSLGAALIVAPRSYVRPSVCLSVR